MAQVGRQFAFLASFSSQPSLLGQTVQTEPSRKTTCSGPMPTNQIDKQKSISRDRSVAYDSINSRLRRQEEE